MNVCVAVTNRYQLFNVISFGVVIASGVLTNVSPRLQQPLLSVTTVAATSAFGYLLGSASFFLVHYTCRTVPGLAVWSATLHTSTGSLGVAFVMLLLASAYQALTRRAEGRPSVASSARGAGAKPVPVLDAMGAGTQLQSTPISTGATTAIQLKRKAE